MFKLLSKTLVHQGAQVHVYLSQTEACPGMLSRYSNSFLSQGCCKVSAVGLAPAARSKDPIQPHHHLLQHFRDTQAFTLEEVMNELLRLPNHSPTPCCIRPSSLAPDEVPQLFSVDCPWSQCLTVLHPRWCKSVVTLDFKP